jgi:hypothetical protein
MMKVGVPSRRKPLSPALSDLLEGLGLDVTNAQLGWRAATVPGDYLVLPSAHRPQLLVPCVPSAGVMIRERRARGLRAKVLKKAIGSTLGWGLAGYLPLLRLNLGQPELADLLDWITETEARPGTGTGSPYTAGILVGPPRANRKPVLRIFAATGHTWGYAKVGINELTNALVRRESDALAEVSTWTLTTLRAPTVLKAGVFAGHRVLATSPMATSGADRQPAALPVEPTRELFSLHARHDVPLRAAPALAKPSSVGSRREAEIEVLADRLMSVLGDHLIPLGASHGDWTPWNLAWTTSGGSRILEAWDWERASVGVPQGHDVIHFEAAKVHGDSPASATADLLARLPSQLAACGIDPALTRPLLATYLLAVGRRYAADLDVGHVAPLAHRLTWVTDLLGREVARLELDRLEQTGRPAASGNSDYSGGTR